MENRMNFIHLWALQLLFRFMLDESPLGYDRQSVAIAEDEGMASPLQAVLSQISNVRIEGKRVFDVNADKCRINISKSKEISQDSIREYLSKYFENLKDDNIEDADTEREHLSYRAQYDEFRSSINEKLNLKDYRIKSQYLPVVLAGYFSDLVELNSYELGLPLKEECAEGDILVIERFYKEDFDSPILVQDFMSMKCRADISKFVQKLPKTTKKIKSSEIDFSKDEQAVMDKVRALKEEGKTYIYVHELEDILEPKIARNKKQKASKTISKLISNINSKCEKLYGERIIGKKISESVNSYAFYEIL